MPTKEEWDEYTKPGGQKDQLLTFAPWTCSNCEKETREIVCLTIDPSKPQTNPSGTVVGYGVKKVCPDCMKSLNPGVPEISEVMQERSNAHFY